MPRPSLRAAALAGLLAATAVGGVAHATNENTGASVAQLGDTTVALSALDAGRATTGDPAPAPSNLAAPTPEPAAPGGSDSGGNDNSGLSVAQVGDTTVDVDGADVGGVDVGGGDPGAPGRLPDGVPTPPGDTTTPPGDTTTPPGDTTTPPGDTTTPPANPNGPAPSGGAASVGVGAGSDTQLPQTQIAGKGQVAAPRPPAPPAPTGALPSTGAMPSSISARPSTGVGPADGDRSGPGALPGAERSPLVRTGFPAQLATGLGLLLILAGTLAARAARVGRRARLSS